jgi:hypothetical protein
MCSSSVPISRVSQDWAEPMTIKPTPTSIQEKNSRERNLMLFPMELIVKEKSPGREAKLKMNPS